MTTVNIDYNTITDAAGQVTAINEAVARNTPAARLAPNDWNGDVGNVDLARPVDYTSDWGKLVKADAADTNFSLRETLIYYIWLAQGRPNTPVGTDPPEFDQAHLETVIPMARILIARYRVYRIIGRTNININYRATDILEPDVVPNNNKLGAIADQVYSRLTEAGAQEALVADAGRMVLFQLIAVAIHREQNEGHSWFTNDTTKRTSPTAKALTIAGRDRAAFAEFMLIHGHDGAHHLATPCLNSIASGLTGHTHVRIENNIDYCGENVLDKHLHEVFNLGEAVKGRFPAGVLGKSAVITGLGLATTMIMHMSSKAKLEGIDGIAANVLTVHRAFSNTNYSHEHIVNMSNRMGPILAMVFGFCENSNLIEEGSHLALENHAKRHIADYTSGRSLAATFKRCGVHEGAIQGAIVASLVRLSDAITTVAGYNAGTAAAPRPVATNMAAVNNNDIKATVGKAPGNVGGAGATIFYESNDGN